MDRPGTRIWTWTLCVLLIWICGVLAAPPHYIVVIPAVLEAGAEAHISARLIEPSETLFTTITLRTKQQNLTLLEERCNLDFFNIYTFQVPSGLNDAVAYLEVEIRGATFYSKEVRKVLIRTYEPLTFIQTDKPLYLPGQTVNFRVVTIDTEFIPVTQLYNTIYIEDPNGNKIGQWLNKTSDGKILQLSYSFNSEAREGRYTIIVTSGKNKLFQSFKVEKYVLPKFEVNIEASDEVSIGQKKINAKVCAQYTFKQPVLGNIAVEICRPLHLFGPFRNAEEIKPPCVVKTIELDNLGCAAFVFEMSAFKRLDRKVVRNYLVLKAKVEEEGTGITYQQEKRIRISLVIGKLTFIDTPKIFEKGSIVAGKIKAVNYNDVPISNLKVYLFGESLSKEVQVQVLTTNSDGIAAFFYSTANSKSEIQLRADIRPDRRRPLIFPGEGYIEPGYIKLSLIQVASPDTKTVSSLEVQKKEEPIPCETEEDISIKYTIVGETQGSATVVWIVLGRGDIVTHGADQIEIQDQTVTEGEISFKIRVFPQMSPHIQIVAYAILPSETVIANSADFSTEKCFSHQVSVEFSPSTSVPGEENTLEFTALPFSLCGVSAVDKSVLIKEPGKTLDINRIFALLPITKSFYFPSEIEDPQDCVVCRQKRFILPNPDGRDDPYTVFKKVGLKVATNLDIRVPSCLKFGGREFIYAERGFGFPFNSRPGRPLARAEAPEGALLPPIATVRTFFPETWIWDLVEIGDEGTTTVTLTVPDTITTWETEVFCLSPMGLGLAPRKELTVFQPFFLELSLPYSIIRGENFELKATVFNYLSSCIMITVTAAPSSEYRLVPKFGVEYTTCLCVNERKTVSWTLIPSALGDLTVSATAETVSSSIKCNNEVVIVPARGRSDTVSRTLKVKAEGIKKIVTSNLLLLPKDNVLTEIVEIQRPENEIVGSGRYLISVLGDIMGRALNNLDDQLRLPYGCGEQNIARLAPNIYILQYLEVTKQLTPDIKAKGINFLISGYQRQLNYRNPDGAFNTFGSGTGNTWLTAFVIRSFVKAQNFIFIDPKVINDAKTWLVNRQKNNGCFEQLGKIFHNRIKGGVSDEVTITAYVTAALLESKSTVTESITKSLSCLKKSLSKFENTYTKALQAYVFTLAGDTETRTLLLSQLDRVAIKERGLTHWDQTATDTSLSLSVEMTSYVLLALLSATPSREELGYAASIVRWLTRQQNFYGGFSSTQDTVAALQALALYSTRVFNSEGSSTVKITTSSGMLNFEVNRNNKLLYQEQLLLVQTGKFTVEVEGNAFVLVQISYLYNIPATSQGTTLEVELSTTCKSSTRPKMTLTMKCLYTGKQPTTNMVILDITILSGFAPYQPSLKKLEEEVERIESKFDQLLVYIKELSFNTPIQYELDLIQEFSVINLQSSAVKIYDYYQPSDQDEACYNNPCVHA